MALIVQTNVPSLEAQRNVYKNQHALSSSFNKLSSGYRINNAADDAAGLAVSESFKSKIRSYTVAERNAGDGISMVQTAEGAHGEVHDILGRMRELAMQASNGSLTDTDRGYLNTEFSALKDEVSRIQSSTKFGTVSLLSSSATSVSFQVGLDSGESISVSFGGLSLTNVSTGGSAAVGNATNAASALATIDSAIDAVSSARASFGAVQNRLDYVTNNIQTMRLNLSAANSRIRDVDVADETAKLSRNQVLTQAGVSVLAQANGLPQLAFGLIGR